MKLISTKWQALILLSIISILAVACVNQHLPATIEADKTVLPRGERTNIKCVVSNSTGNVSYEWSSSDGSIQGEGELVEWVAPNSTGNYFIRVNAIEEDSGRKGTAFLTITVIENQSPIIEDMVITADHKYLKAWQSSYLVGKEQEYRIECQAWDEDNDNLTYEWSSSEGNIVGNGSQVTWIAPSIDSTAMITVTVSDGGGGVATQELPLKVVRCSSCTFK